MIKKIDTILAWIIIFLGSKWGLLCAAIGLSFLMTYDR